MRRRESPTRHCSDSNSVAERRCSELVSAIRRGSFVADRKRLLGDPINKDQVYADLQRTVDGTTKLIDGLVELSTYIVNVSSVSARESAWLNAIDHVQRTMGRLNTALGCSANTALVHMIAYTVLSRWAQYERGSDYGAIRRKGAVPCNYFAEALLARSTKCERYKDVLNLPPIRIDDLKAIGNTADELWNRDLRESDLRRDAEDWQMAADSYVENDKAFGRAYRRLGRSKKWPLVLNDSTRIVYAFEASPQCSLCLRVRYVFESLAVCSDDARH
jgi:hypothetical protein